MGRNPSDMSKNPKCRRGLWSPDEDEKLRSYILQHGHGCWTSLPTKSGLQRNGKSCGLRWVNYLRPGLNRDMFTLQEEETILSLHRTLGNKWSHIAHHLPGRTNNDVKNHWHSCLKKKKIESEIEKAKESRSTESSSISSIPNVSSFESLSSAKLTQLAPKSHQNILPRLLFAMHMDIEHKTNPKEAFMCSNSSGNNLHNLDMCSSMSNSFGKEDHSVGNYVISGVQNQPEVENECKID